MQEKKKMSDFVIPESPHSEQTAQFPQAGMKSVSSSTADHPVHAARYMNPVHTSMIFILLLLIV